MTEPIGTLLAEAVINTNIFVDSDTVTHTDGEYPDVMETFTLRDPPAQLSAPEPSAALLCLLGIALVGLGLRRRRGRVADIQFAAKHDRAG